MYLRPLGEKDVSREVAGVYQDFCARMGFPSAPNFIMTQGYSAVVVAGTWGLVRNVLVSGLLPRWLKEMMFVAISQDRNCKYCEAAHLACCRMLGVNSKTINILVSDISNLPDVKTREIISFAVKCSHDPQSLTPEDFAALETHGLSRAEIMEIIAMSALAVYANIIADATQMEPDEMFNTV